MWIKRVTDGLTNREKRKLVKFYKRTMKLPLTERQLQGMEEWRIKYNVKKEK